MADSIHPAAIEHLPPFITAPGQTDYLFYGVIIFLIVVVLVIGNLYFQLHAVPERMAHRTSKVQMEIVAVLALISLFTHNHLFWIAGLLLAFVHIPDFSTPLYSIADSLAKLSGRPTVDEETDNPARIEHSEPASLPEPVVRTNTMAEGSAHV
ncbi:hypothetical protein [Rhizobium sp. Root1204]|uniref:hypothetical protein n=1 Tax=Rhizobium sp. Root1204 TaxID=1736428 RepID=UPI000715E4C5|nr:hypothetical protein [Rhizobium sp. Root1204]KQV36249.1 hypothetical protein ASC96_28590 [Rhizobium sp. Root1204]